MTEANLCQFSWLKYIHSTPNHCLFLADGDFKKLDTKYFCELLSECKVNYDRLGLHLDVGWEKVKEIEKVSGGDCVKCLSEMLEFYLRELKPSVEEVCKALELVDRRGLSDDLRKKYGGKNNMCLFFTLICRK